MAITVNEQVVGSWGFLRSEIGKFTTDAVSGELKTKLGYIVYVEVAAAGTNTDTAFAMWLNSRSASAVEDDPGWIHWSGGLATGSYVYQAVGRG